LNGAEYVIKFLEHKEVDIIFGYPGGKVLTLYDALYKAIENKSRLKHILTRHEQGAAHAAEGYARTTGKTGVVIATSGPGATNLVTGLADAMLDSTPIFAITGQVNVPDIGHDAFQEADVVGVTMSVTKHNHLLRDIKELPYVLEEAWQIAREGRLGPVLIDIPSNLFATEADFPSPGDVTCKLKKREKINSFESQKNAILDLFTHSFRPVILAGGGMIVSKEAPGLMRRFIEKYNIPCAVTLMGKSVIDQSHPLALGMAGMHGHPVSNAALSKGDLVIAVGARFSDRTVGNPKLFSQTKSIIHADIDIAEISKNVKVNIPVVTDSAEFFANLLDLDIPESKIAAWKEWHNELLDVEKKMYERNAKIAKTFYLGKLKMRELIRTVTDLCDNRDVSYVTDVGQHQMIAAQETRHKTPGTFITSGGAGTMGFGLPAAVGAAFGKTTGQVILFSGDGGIQMNIQELATVRKTNIPVKIFILDNNRLGMVTQWQKILYGGRYSQTVLDDNPDFAAIAAAYGIKGITINTRQELNENIEDIINSNETILVHVLTDPEEDVFPMVPSGKSNHEMILGLEKEGE